MILPHRGPGPEDVARHYHDLDGFYRELWGDHVHHGFWRTGRETPREATLELVRHVAELARIGPGDRVVDVGSGYGATARWLTRERGARVTAITLSPAQHAGALRTERDGRKGWKEPRYVLGDWLENEEASSSFDRALAIESTEHMADIGRALDEMGRVLRPGGRLVVCAWLARENASAWEVRHLLRPICAEGRLARLLTAAELERLLTDRGLIPEGVRDYSREVSRTWTVCMGRALRRLMTDAEARRFLFDPSQPERIFARTLIRIRVAFALGSLRYGIVAAVRREGA